MAGPTAAARLWRRPVVALVVAVIGQTAVLDPGPAVAAPVPVIGLVNPLAASPRPVANGTNASAAAQVRVRFVRGGHRPASQVNVLPTRRALVSGTIQDPRHRPIAGAVLVIVVQFDGQPAAAVAGAVRSDGRGHFAFPLRPGTSRTVAIVYYPASISTAYLTSNALREREATTIRLAVAPHVVRGGRSVHFRGQVVGVSGVKLLVALQVLRAGAGFQTFRVVRTRPTGRFDAGFRFSRGPTAAYRFRALVIAQNGFAYGTSVSHSTFVLVRG